MTYITEMYPPIEPRLRGMLDVGDGNRVYWEECGNPEGKPVLVVHGGPGSGCRPGLRRMFDPGRCRIILFDQRGCGRSTPHASDPATDMRHNTTAHLIADMERLRERLGVGRWLLYGGSWGSTLALAYAQTHPERVSEIVLQAVTTSRRSETDWLYRGASRFFPEAWDRFRAGAPGVPADGEGIVAAYARLTGHSDPAVRAKATADWCAWEDSVLLIETAGATTPYTDRADLAKLAFARICAHYFAHGAWLEEGALLRDAGRLAGIPGALIHGRLDMVCPVGTVWELAKAWPDAELTVVEDAGHMGSEAMLDRVLRTLDRFAGAPR
ncbi:proline iminopeptidase [Streptomyces inusitatus]|uniref:Proline iminopeptidase n=1 Tax=Streptomyces inusitatus TaxID=68221 RepID=A0A918PZ60_9ACTN|nr:prolyl aminopeptidase [Streptomyces inusitatus]GGZ28036.1 proline iminopeptidase [Streptomyces inusitatus]